MDFETWIICKLASVDSIKKVNYYIFLPYHFISPCVWKFGEINKII